MTIREALAITVARWALLIGGRKFRKEMVHHWVVGEFVVDARRQGIPMAQIEVFE